jgi:hypothetical protein
LNASTLENFYVSLTHLVQLIPLPVYHLLCSFTICIFCSAAFALPSPEASELSGHYLKIEENLLHSPLLRPLQINSQSNADHLSGEIYAVVEFEMTKINSIAGSSERWCEVMLLLSNCQACVVSANNRDALLVRMSSSKTADMDSTPPTEFKLIVKSIKDDYLDIALAANEGPLGTRNINLNLRAIPLSNGRSFVHLHYAYDTQWLGRMAMQTYLQTAGRGKTGFSRTKDTKGEPTPISGVRGVIERNTMRYFLGFECALSLKSLTEPERFRSMSQCWYEQVEKYPLQLHEMQRTEYLDMKSLEYGRHRNSP